MNIVKHMEAVFVVTLAVAGCAGYVATAIPEAHAQQLGAAANSIATSTKMAVVTVSAKRMSDAEKRQSLIEERKLAGSI